MMRCYTIHAHPTHETVLVREAFSWGALLLPTLWFLWNRMWLVAVLHLAGLVFLSVAIGGGWAAGIGLWILLAAQILTALHARDLRRWTLARRGFDFMGVVLARDEESGFARLATEHPDLLAEAQ